MSRKLFSVDPNLEQALAAVLKRRGQTIHEYIRGALRNQMERDGIAMPKRKLTGRPFTKKETPEPEEPATGQGPDDELDLEEDLDQELDGQGRLESRADGEPF